MKLYHMIGLGTAGLLSLTALGFMAPKSEVPENVEYKIETLSGDANLLADLQFEAIAKTGPNQYSKVVLTHDGAQLTKTKYDPLRGAGEQVLNNRDLFRHLGWATKLETTDYIVLADFNSSYLYTNEEPLLRLHSKELSTGEVLKKDIILKELNYGESTLDEYLTEYEGDYYYITRVYSQLADKNNKLLIYQLNPQTLELTLKFEEEFSATNYPAILVEGGKMYEVDLSLGQLKVRNLKTNESTVYSLSYKDENASINELVPLNNDYFFNLADTLVKGMVNEESKSIELVEMVQPKFLATLNEKYDLSYIKSMVSHDDLLYVTYVGRKNTSSAEFIAIINPKTNEVVYEGKLDTSLTQGLAEDYKLHFTDNDSK